MGYVPVCGEKEYYLACACDELYAPPSAYFSLYGMAVQASFLGGNFLFKFNTQVDRQSIKLLLVTYAEDLCDKQNTMQ